MMQIVIMEFSPYLFGVSPNLLAVFSYFNEILLAVSRFLEFTRSA